MKEIPGDIIALVDKNDNVIGFENKMKVHEEGMLHRAFSIFIINDKGELLLQKRAAVKYHSPSLWTNTCCSHLLPNKTLEECAHDRMQFEMGFDCEFEKKFVFQYTASFDNNLIENEIDHVYIGRYQGDVNPNKDEVGDYKWISMVDLVSDVDENPKDYTFWFKHIIEHYHKEIHL